MTRKVIFRADGNSSIGLGHLYRLFSLVEIVKESIDLIFLTHETSTYSVIPESYKKIIIPGNIKIEQEPKWLDNHFSSEEYIIIADGYQFNTTYQKQIKSKGFRLIYIDDLAKEHIYADAVINHSPFLRKTHYSKEVYTQLALGTKYALLRPLFLDQAKHHRKINVIDSAFVCFGGADSFNLTFKAVQALLQIPEFKKIHIVLGAAFQHVEIFEMEEKYSDTIKTYKNLSEESLIKVMHKSNFAIAPASTILYELCCVKMPILSGFYVDNQELIYKGFLNKNAIYKGGNMKDYKVSDFINIIQSILKEGKFHLQMEAQKSLFDGKIASRHLKLITSVC